MFSISFAVLMLFQIASCEEPDEPKPPAVDWIQIPRFEGEYIQTMMVLDSSIYVAGDSIYISTDDAKTWKSISDGLPVPAKGYFWMMALGSLIVNDTTYLFVGTAENGIYRSTDKGMSWQQVNDGLDRFYITALASCDGIIYATASDYNGYAKVYYSTDRGQSWIESTNAPAKAFGASVSIGNTIFFSTAWNGVMITRNKGMTWTCTYDPKTGKAEGEVYATWIESIAGNGKDVFIVGNAYTYYTMNLGYSWILVGGAQYTTPGGNHAVMKDSTLMVDYFVSHNYGRTWSEVNKGLPWPGHINALAMLGNKVYLGLGESGVWVNTSILKH